MGTLSPVTTKDFKLQEATPAPSLLKILYRRLSRLTRSLMLESKGSWLHCGYHLTTSIVGPALLSLPFAFATLGWAPGVACLSIGAITSFCSYNLLSAVIEHHATLAPPVTGKMFKGLCVCYAVIVVTFFSVSVSGYWAFGNQAAGTLISNFMGVRKPLVLKWFFHMTNVFILLQDSAVCVVYLPPTNEVLEGKFADPKKDQFSARNVIPRLAFRSLAVIIATTIAAMPPFFGVF